MRKSAFLSHASSDYEKVKRFRAELQKEKLDTWIAPDDIPTSMAYSDAIMDGIEECPVFVLFLTKSANQSEMVANEVERAANRGKPIVVVRLEDLKPSRSLEFFVSRVQWFDVFSRSIDDAVAGLSQTLASLANVEYKRSVKRAVAHTTRAIARKAAAFALFVAVLAGIGYGGYRYVDNSGLSIGSLIASMFSSSPVSSQLEKLDGLRGCERKEKLSDLKHSLPSDLRPEDAVELIEGIRDGRCRSQAIEELANLILLDSVNPRELKELVGTLSDHNLADAVTKLKASLSKDFKDTDVRDVLQRSSDSKDMVEVVDVLSQVLAKHNGSPEALLQIITPMRHTEQERTLAMLIGANASDYEMTGEQTASLVSQIKVSSSNSSAARLNAIVMLSPVTNHTKVAASDIVDMIGPLNHDDQAKAISELLKLNADAYSLSGAQTASLVSQIKVSSSNSSAARLNAIVMLSPVTNHTKVAASDIVDMIGPLNHDDQAKAVSELLKPNVGAYSLSGAEGSQIVNQIEVNSSNSSRSRLEAIKTIAKVVRHKEVVAAEILGMIHSLRPDDKADALKNLVQANTNEYLLEGKEAARIVDQIKVNSSNTSRYRLSGIKAITGSLQHESVGASDLLKMIRPMRDDDAVSALSHVFMSNIEGYQFSGADAATMLGGIMDSDDRLDALRVLLPRVSRPVASKQASKLLQYLDDDDRQSASRLL